LIETVERLKTTRQVINSRRRAKEKKNAMSETYPFPRQAAIRSENLGKRKARKEEQ
jgi:hypothetical protein